MQGTPPTPVYELTLRTRASIKDTIGLPQDYMGLEVCLIRLQAYASNMPYRG